MREQLLKRILASRQFAHADSLKRILQYVCQHSEGPESLLLKEYDIAVNAIGRSRDFDARLDPIVRVSMANLRARLKAFFETEGIGETQRLVIPKGQYRAVFESHVSTRPKLDQRTEPYAFRKFWAPYLSGGFANVLLYSELLFFRDQYSNFVRSFCINDPFASEEELKSRIPNAEAGSLRPSYNFLSAGEARCMFSLLAMFHVLGAVIETRNSRYSSWNELQQCNVILLGSSRTSSFLDLLQSGNDFVVMEDRIEIRDAQPHEDECYRGRRYNDGKLQRVTEYALLTRRPSVAPRCSITTIAANHGRAYEGAGRVLTLENELGRLLEKIGVEEADSLPQHFQVLLRVDMVDFDEEVVNVEYVTHRVYR
jgi:hypothetical protein